MDNSKKWEDPNKDITFEDLIKGAPPAVEAALIKSRKKLTDGLLESDQRMREVVDECRESVIGTRMLSEQPNKSLMISLNMATVLNDNALFSGMQLLWAIARIIDLEKEVEELKKQSK